MQPMHDNFDLRQEQLNKSSLLSSKAFIDNLLDVLRSHIVSLIFVLWGVRGQGGIPAPWTVYEVYFIFILQKLGTGALVISALLDFVTFAICPPYRWGTLSLSPSSLSLSLPPLPPSLYYCTSSPPPSETTPGAMFDMVLELTASLNRGLFKLFQHPSLAIVKAAGLIMKAIIEVSNCIYLSVTVSVSTCLSYCLCQ